MKKFIFISFLVTIMTIFTSCSDTTSSNNGYGLPNEFPLEEGNAWIYEKVSYTNELRDTAFIDTLYIAGKFEDYYLYTWNPEHNISLVKNIDNKLVCYGHINSYNSQIDTIFFDLTEIWAFYGETGYIDSTYYTNYSYGNIDSEYISILPNEEYFDKKYDTYRREITFFEFYFCKSMRQYTNKLGFVCWEFFDEDNNLFRTDKMIEKLENFYPEEILLNKNRVMEKTINRKLNYSQYGVEYQSKQ